MGRCGRLTSACCALFQFERFGWGETVLFRFTCGLTGGRHWRRAWLWACVGLLAVRPVFALEAVTLQLKWSHAFQFAGYYTAVEKGFYREAGLDVSLLEAHPGTSVLASVREGRAQYGVGTSSLLLDRAAGQPVVVLAVVFQHSPQVLLMRQNKHEHGTQGIHDLLDKRVMIEPHADELLAYLKQEGIRPDRLQQVPHTFNPQDLIDGKVDAMSAYITNEPYILDQAGARYHTYTPRSAGIDFYGDNLFTTEGELAAHPDRVRAFREASLRGWRYAMENPGETADLIVAKYSKVHARDFFLFEARRMEPLLRTDLIEVGYMTRGRWQHIADTYADLGLLPRDQRLDGFLYDPVARPDRSLLYLALALLTVVTAIAFHIFRLNRRLARALADTRQAEERIRQLAFFDSLTQLPNRRMLQDRLAQAIARYKRQGGHGALLFLDLDNFKNLNDTHGHAYGDLLLTTVAQRLRECVREADTVARLGGDEFVVLLDALGNPAEQAVTQAKRVADQVLARLAVPYELPGPGGSEPVVHVCTASIGMVPLDGACDPDHAQRRADAAMYQAKRMGRNRVFVEPGGAVGGSAAPP